LIALFGNLSLLEVVAIAALSVMVFGRDLPRVAAQVVTHVQRARRALQKVWRESGIGDEIRQVQREIEHSTDKLKRLSPHETARSAIQDLDADIRRPLTEPEQCEEDGQRGDDGSLGDPEPVTGMYADDDTSEPAGEEARRPPWYPEEDGPPVAEEHPDEGGAAEQPSLERPETGGEN
jgi:Sec-independent protein translocase protein TatA